ncbi:conserved protein of unknown function [Rhodovastum atsumiense]|uniref:Uncharacterized protein n=1 Tax=Rhodovastum atsumiense TaxID=504468 RepID=A0A5M6IU40_9PROT|nr:hypothetical protein [Rhodovastum atsumiense]KAA5610945.1 hypothetical protein F1189_17065 [Rhodovastum atsumiense]CAH2601481.1 conserved protein of unknown function [Rhodovastum atsumiense]
MPTQAVRAADFTRSISVQIHMGHGGGGRPYGNMTTLQNALAYLNPKGIGTGVGVVRDETWASSDLATLGRLGYKLDVYVAYNQGANSASGAIDALRPLVNAGYVRMVEGPLEVDNVGWGLVRTGSYTALNGQTYAGWQAAVKWQQDLYNTFASKTDVALFSLANPANGNASSPAVSAARSLGLSLNGITELGNVHFYQHNGNSPATEMPGVIRDETGYTPGKPFAITETGFNDLNDGSTNYLGSAHANGVYTLDLALNAFKAGCKLTNLYELFDENMGYAAQGIAFEDHWGLFNANGTPKAAATYLRNMMSVLGDSGANAGGFAPGSLNYSVSGLGSNGQTLLMQKSGGVYDIAVWANASVFTGGHAGTAPTQNVTVNLGGTYGSVKVYDPVRGSNAVQTLSNVSSVRLGVTDHPLIIEVGGQGSGRATSSGGTPAAASPASPGTAAAPSGSHVINVAGGRTVTTQPGTRNTVNITGSATVNAKGTDTIRVTAGNTTVNGGTGHLVFVGGGAGKATLNLRGGTTEATLGNGGSAVKIAGHVTATAGGGTDLFTLTRDASIDTAVIYNFKAGTDHLHLAGYGSGTAGVAWVADAAAGTSVHLTDGSHVGLVGVHSTDLGRLFA